MAAYLYEHQNPHAPVRDNGKRFMGYPGRLGPIVAIGVHTAENLPDLNPPDLGAESVARYFASTSRAASAHENVDTDSHVTCLPDRATAFAAIGYNSRLWHIELCTQAHKWADLPPQWKDKLLRRAARRCARRAVKYDIPIRRATRAQINEAIRTGDPSKGGFVAHADLDPSRRSDPGPDFPWKTFLAYVRMYALKIDQDVPTPVPNATPTLRRTHKGTYVREAARHLIRHGGRKSVLTNKAGRPLWRFNANMEREVRKFQRRSGLPVDGIIGPKTWRALRRR